MNTNPARGMRDFLPEDVRRRQYVIAVIADVYQRYGFEPLETPAVENIETLMGKYGEEGDRLIFRILRRGEEGKAGDADLALRYDLTVPLARVVAHYRAELPKFFKRYQVQPVWRADRPQKGRFREFYQCDVDAIGTQSVVVEVEILMAACEVFTQLGFNAFAIRLNHRQVLGAVLESAGIAPQLHDATLVALDKMDKIGPDGVNLELRNRGVPDAAAVDLIDFFSRVNRAANLSNSDPLRCNDEILTLLEPRVSGHQAGPTAVGELREIVRLLNAAGYGDRIRLDPSVARGLSYYTGAVFELIVPGIGFSLAGGGRYDDLIGMFLGQKVPACGISLGLERILVVMSERKMFPQSLTATPADVMVTIWNANTAADAIRLAGELRQAGLRVDLYPEPDKIGKQVKYADARGIRFVTIVGEEESARGQVAVKNLSTGEQHVVSRGAVADFVKNAAGAPVPGPGA
jgi:histidyl-tRNA synthetase